MIAKNFEDYCTSLRICIHSSNSLANKCLKHESVNVGLSGNTAVKLMGCNLSQVKQA